MQTFTQKVYNTVRNIPKGKTLSYSEVAELAGNQKAYRAVGNILHNSPRNVPCHRVVSKSGKLAKNFGKGGIENQRELLKKEGLESFLIMILYFDIKKSTEIRTPKINSHKIKLKIRSKTKL